MAQLRFNELFHLIRAYKALGVYKVTLLYNQLAMDIKMAAHLLNVTISVFYMTVPFIIGLLWQMVFHDNGLDRIIALFGLVLIFTFNYIIYWMASSICLNNKVLVKLLHPIQSDTTPRPRLTRLHRCKIDSFVARLNKEFVGFRCLYSIKFTKLSFYNYVLGISSTYFMLSDFPQ